MADIRNLSNRVYEKDSRVKHSYVNMNFKIL